MSGSSLDRLIYMANQIAGEFACQRPGEAAQATYDHIWHFWDPRMRTMILDHLERGGDGLGEITRAAVIQLRDSHGTSRPVTKATEFNQALDQDADRDLMSDAG